MHDPIPSRDAPRDWAGAFAALSAETPPPGGWQALAPRLPPGRRRTRWPLPLAAAACLLLAVALPWWRTSAPDIGEAAGIALSDPPLERLHAESARLESLVLHARDERVSSAAEAVLGAELDARLATIDAALMQPGLPRETQLSLWRQRVDSLRLLAGFESNRLWLTSHGSAYDAALVRVD